MRPLERLPSHRDRGGYRETGIWLSEVTRLGEGSLAGKERSLENPAQTHLGHRL